MNYQHASTKNATACRLLLVGLLVASLLGGALHAAGNGRPTRPALAVWSAESQAFERSLITAHFFKTGARLRDTVPSSTTAWSFFNLSRPLAVQETAGQLVTDTATHSGTGAVGLAAPVVRAAHDVVPDMPVWIGILLLALVGWIVVGPRVRSGRCL